MRVNDMTFTLFSLQSDGDQARTFLNCHKLFLNTVSISLRAKINPAHDLHIGIARFVLAELLERGATRLWHSFCSTLPAPGAPFHGLNDIRPLAHLNQCRSTYVIYDDYSDCTCAGLVDSQFSRSWMNM